MKQPIRWFTLILGATGLTLSAAAETPPAQPAVKCQAPCCATKAVAEAEADKPVAELDAAAWSNEVAAALDQVKQDTEKAMSVLEESTDIMTQVMEGVTGMAQALEESFESPEFKEFTEKMTKDIQSASQPLKDIDWEGFAESMESMAAEDLETLEALAARFLDHLAEGMEAAESPKPTESDEAKPATSEDLGEAI